MHLKYILATFIFCAIFVSSHTVEASIEGRHGWVTLVSDVDENPPAKSCPVGSLNYMLEIRDVDDQSLISVDLAFFASINDNTGDLVDYVQGTGPILGPICMNPDTDVNYVDIYGGSYNNLWTYNVFSKTNPIPADFRDASTTVTFTETVWLDEATDPQHYNLVSPSDVITRTPPPYVFALNYIPNLDGATRIASAKLFVFEGYDAINRTIDAIVEDTRITALAGGVGQKTISATPLANMYDGIFNWGIYIRLNGIKNFTMTTGTLSTWDIPSSGFVTPALPFIFDRTKPVKTSLTHTPASPDTNDVVSIQGSATDALAGITNIALYIDGVLHSQSTYSAVSSASFDTLIGTQTEGDHTYFFVAKDAAGNIATTTTKTFTVTPVLATSCPIPVSTILSSVSAQALTAKGTPQALATEGDLLYVGASGLEEAVGLYIYRVNPDSSLSQLSYLSTQELPAQIYAWGNDVLGIDVNSGFAYLATYYGGLVIVDVSNPSNPIYKGKLPLYNLSMTNSPETWDVEVSGNYAYVASGNDMVVVDVSDPTNPVVASNSTSNGGPVISQAITLAGNYAYTAVRGLGLVITDISNPLAPIKTVFNDAFNASHWAYDLVVKDQYLYVSNINLLAGQDSEIRIYDISNPTSPSYISSIQISNPGLARALHIDGDTLFVGASEVGAYVFDISNRTNPALLFSVGKPPLLAGARIWDVVPVTTGGFTTLVIVSEDENSGVYVTNTDCNGTQADLVATNLSPAPNAVLNDGLINFQGSIQNFSEINVAEGGYIHLEIDWDSNGGADDTYSVPNDTTPMGAFSANEAKVFSYTMTSLPSGVHRFRFFADTANIISETDEANNYSDWSTFNVLNGVLNVNPINIDSGQSVSVSWNIEGTNPGMNCMLQGGSDTWSWYGMEVSSQTTNPLDSDTTYVLSCEGIPLDSETVRVNGEPEMTIVPRIVPKGATSTIMWNTHNGDEGSCTLRNGPNTINHIPSTEGDPNTGYATIVVEGRSQYALTCPTGITTFEVEIVPTAFEI